MKNIKFSSRLATRIAAGAGILITTFVVLASAQLAFAQSKELSLADILIALRSKKAVIEEKNRILTDAVKQRGITFTLTPEIEKELGTTGAYRNLIDAIRQKAAQAKTDSNTVKSEPTQIAMSVAKPLPPPPDFNFYRTRATSAMNAGDLDSALLDLGKAIELKPADGPSYLDRGVTYNKKEKYDLAADDLTKAADLSPKDSVVFFNRGFAREKLGRMDEAVADYQKAADLDPKNEAAKLAAARLHETLAKTVEKPIEKQPVEKVIVDPPKPVVTASTKTLITSVGALNSYATRLVTPVYSAFDRKLGVQGRVTVQIMLDTEGKVTSVQASDGPKTLRAAAEDAIKKSKFRPVLNGDAPIAASGYIVFNFISNP